MVDPSCSHSLLVVSQDATCTPSGVVSISPSMYVTIASLSLANFSRASESSAADASCTAAMSIFMAGDPSEAEAVARLPAFARTFSTLSLYSSDWIFRYGSTMDDGIGAPPSGVLDVPGAGRQPAAKSASAIRLLFIGPPSMESSVSNNLQSTLAPPRVPRPARWRGPPASRDR